VWAGWPGGAACPAAATAVRLVLRAASPAAARKGGKRGKAGGAGDKLGGAGGKPGG